MTKTITVNNLANFEFWVGMFKLRSKQWKRVTLARLQKSQSVFETESERQDKIKALQFLLNN
jgi:hypothetical protein